MFHLKCCVTAIRFNSANAVHIIGHLSRLNVACYNVTMLQALISNSQLSILDTQWCTFCTYRDTCKIVLLWKFWQVPGLGWLQKVFCCHILFLLYILWKSYCCDLYKAQISWAIVCHKEQKVRMKCHCQAQHWCMVPDLWSCDPGLHPRCVSISKSLPLQPAGHCRTVGTGHRWWERDRIYSLDRVTASPPCSRGGAELHCATWHVSGVAIWHVSMVHSVTMSPLPNGLQTTSAVTSWGCCQPRVAH